MSDYDIYIGYKVVEVDTLGGYKVVLSRDGEGALLSLTVGADAVGLTRAQLLELAEKAAKLASELPEA